MTIDEATKIAKSIIRGWKGEWPEDEWISISEEWDLNLFGGNKTKGASLYPVRDGQTQTGTIIAVFA